MTTETPPDWVLLEAARLSGWDVWPIDTLRRFYLDDLLPYHDGYRALCDMIQKYEKPPVDRKARYFNRYLTDAEVDEQVAQMRSEK